MTMLPSVPEYVSKVHLNANAKLVLEKRYYRKDGEGHTIENAERFFWRIAHAIAQQEAAYATSPYSVEELAHAFYVLMTEWRFLPNSPTLMNAGTELGQLSACFVLPVGDSIEEIFDAVKHAAMIHKSGGGTGFSFSRLRPKDSRVGSTGGVASGPLSFLRIFNTATEQIKQGGTRRGANMGILRVDHPDIIDFIRAKECEGEFNNFNLSVALTEAFMQSVADDTEYPLIAPESGKEKGRLRAREVFELLVRKAWESGDPGIVFIDRINRDNPTPDQGAMESTNPCGEQPLLPYEACNLGSINLAMFYVPAEQADADTSVAMQNGEHGGARSDAGYVKSAPLDAHKPVVASAYAANFDSIASDTAVPCASTSDAPRPDTVTPDTVISDTAMRDTTVSAPSTKAEGETNTANTNTENASQSAFPAEKGIAWEALKRTIHLSVRFLDNVIDASRFPLDRIDEQVRKNRKIGLGVMGWADLLYQLGIPYDSQRALELAEVVMAFVQKEARAASHQLACERGAFPAYATSRFAERNMGPYRNATVTTIAPTGTLSILAGCSSGVEPLFALSFARHVMDGERLVEVNPYFEKALKHAGLYTADRMERVTSKGSIRAMEDIPRSLRAVFATAMDIAPIWHLKMQAAFQRFTDNAVSKTVNVPNTATVDDIRSIYWMAYEEGCKGVTVYRDGCKSDQVLFTGEAEKKAEPTPAQQADCIVRQRPDVVFGFTQKIQTGLGVMYLTVNEVNGKPFEVFATIGKSGRSITAKAEAIGRLVSLALRSGIPVRDIVVQLKGIGGEHPVFQKKGLLLSIPDAIAWVLENRYMQGEAVVVASPAIEKELCPECGEELVFQEGCHLCPACGHTRCG